MLTPTGEDKPDNPFIFTPITNHHSMSILETRRTASNSIITDIVWVQDEPCSTVMVIKNTLPFELRITSIKLLTDGVPLETKSASLNMDPNLQTAIQLIGIPRQLPQTTDDSSQHASRLEIFGYSTHVLGVRSNCRLDMIPRSKFPNQFVVEISPPLPRIEFQFPEDLDGISVDPIPADQVDKNLIVMEIRAQMRLGGDTNTQLTILNSSNVDVEYMFIKEKQQRTLVTPNLEKLITLDEQIIDNLHLNPLRAGEKINVPVRIAASKSLYAKAKSLSTTLLFEYSGGHALQEMYCRKCAILFTIDVKEEKEEKRKEKKAVDEVRTNKVESSDPEGMTPSASSSDIEASESMTTTSLARKPSSSAENKNERE